MRFFLGLLIGSALGLYIISGDTNNAKRNNFKTIAATVTSYCPCQKCCGKFADGRTATGTSAYVPGIAADPRRYPYGTVIDIPGYGKYKVDDTGGAMRNSVKPHFDVRFKTHQEALQWGRQKLKVEVYAKTN